MMLAAFDNDMDLAGGALLKPESDSLVIDRGALSAGVGLSGGCEVGVGGVEEGRLVGRKREGRSACIMVRIEVSRVN
jgi:hypothetical protein